MSKKIWTLRAKLTVMPLTIGLSLICLGIASGKQDSEQQFLSFNTCPIPCFMGIVPGKTDISKAHKIIESTIPPSQIIWEGYFWIRDSYGAQIYVEIERTSPLAGNYVKSINLSSHGSGQVTSLGSIISSSYSPQRVFRNRIHGPDALNLFIVFGPDMTLMAKVCAIGVVSPYSPVCDLTIAAPQDKDWVLEEVRLTQHYDYEIPWLGFISRETYLETAER